ncbi:MAG TPA: FAD-binding oxidoreductase [Candidatus Saccharimonadales bacterium]|nr:FAD-binding oxidoreductase [Candidatus Saccharimonadales bacterium]
MNPALLEELKTLIKGDVATDEDTLMKHSHDASLFEVIPQVVVFPKDAADVQAIIKFVTKHKKDHPHLSITGRSAGTDMGGGSINDSIILDFQKYFNKIGEIKNNIGTAEPGVFYRDFEKETLKQDLLFASYPASRELCAIGGIVNNNSGGEKSLQYGKTENFVKRTKVVLSDGNVYEFKALTRQKLRSKLAKNDFEGKVYQKIYKLIKKNYDLLQQAKPKVSKNSAGYFLWNIWDKEKDIFDMNKLWVGAQGTLGMLLEADLELVPVQKHHEMEIIFLHDLKHLGEIIDAVLPLKPESFESYDDNTLKLALRFFPEFAKQLGIPGLVQSGLAFAPAFLEMFIGKLPKLILQIDFAGNDPEELKEKIAMLREKLKPLHPETKIAIEDQEKKYWLVRRESFNLLRNKIRDKHTAPFIDDFVINPHDIGEVIPQITDVVKRYPEFIYTVAGHVGDGNFHIIPLVDIKNPSVRDAIPHISDDVYKIISKYKGSITGEHNDGLIRTPYLEGMYGKEIIKLFEETKYIFDPHCIFNPRKKVRGDLKYAMDHIRTNWDTIKIPTK